MKRANLSQAEIDRIMSTIQNPRQNPAQAAGLKAELIIPCPHCSQKFPIVINVPVAKFEVYVPEYGRKGEVGFVPPKAS